MTTKYSPRYISSLGRALSLAALLLLSVLTVGAHEQDYPTDAKKLITSVDQVTCPMVFDWAGGNPASVHSIKYMIDYEGNDKFIDAQTYYFGTNQYTLDKGQHYMDVRLNETFTDKDLVLFIRHTANQDKALYHPLRFEIQAYNEDNKIGEPIYVDIRYRGFGSQEISEKFTIPGTFNKLRFVCVKSSTSERHYAASGEEIIPFRIAQFQLFEYTENATYYGWKDSYRHEADWPQQQDKYNIVFKHTRGVHSPINHATNGLKNWSDCADWNQSDDNLDPTIGTWTQDTVLLKQLKIKMADFSYATPKSDDRIKQGVRQRTHEIVHTVYAVPGEPVLLQPYYGFKSTQGYMENFSRWYDYSTDETSPYVYLPCYSSETSKHAVRTKSGLLAGSAICDGEGQTGTFGTFYCPADEDFDELYIAADYSQTFNLDGAKHIDGNTYYEPMIVFRHIFHVINAQKGFAEKFSGSKENNRNFVDENKRIISARANHDVQIRSDFPLPRVEEIPSGLYYKTATGEVKRICMREIQVFQNNVQIYADNTTKQPIFKADNPYETDPIKIVFSNGVNFDYYPRGWRKEWKSHFTYDRFLLCEAKNAKEGKYTVRLVAKDENGDIIYINGDTDAPLIVQEYEITLLSDKEAHLCDEQELAKGEKYYDQSEESLDKAFPKGPIATLDFDKYYELEKALDAQQPGLSERYFVTDLQTVKHIWGGGSGHNVPVVRWDTITFTGKRFRWPIDWDHGNYGYGYDRPWDFAMYAIANRGSAVLYNGRVGEAFRDRLYINDKNKNPKKAEADLKKGYFYWVNAAEDPGVTAIAEIDDLCPGSTLYVSGWIAEFGGGSETANMIFNFQAKVKDDESVDEDFRGKNITVHSYITGYVSGDSTTIALNNGTTIKTPRGRWQHIYYTFTPNLGEYGLTSNNIESYQLVLENNAKNSSGADYAIDDVRVYVSQPQITAEQEPLICLGVKEAHIKVSIPFNQILASFGETEADTKSEGKQMDLFYTYVDKAKYEKAKAEGSQHPFDDAVLWFEYMEKGDTTNYGKISFNSFFKGNTEYSHDEHYNSYNEAYWEEIQAQNQKLLSFNTRPSDNAMASGKEYIIALFVQDPNAEGAITAPTRQDFDLENRCAKRFDVRIKSTGIVKIDGITAPDLDNVTLCANQEPTIQIDLMGYTKLDDDGNPQSGTKPELLEPNAYLDWFEGTCEEYDAVTDGIPGADGKPTYLNMAMAQFRNAYPDAISAEGPEIVPVGDSNFELTQAMIDLIVKYTKITNEKTGHAKLQLYKRSYTFPPLTVEAGQKESVNYVTAIPIDHAKGLWLICSEPKTIYINIRNESPLLHHGFPGGVIDYPDDMTDVPFRASLTQLKNVSFTKNDEEMPSGQKCLMLPVRKLKVVTDGAQGIVKADKIESASEKYGVEIDPMIYLSYTNDPEYDTLLPILDENGMAIGQEPVGLVDYIAAKDGGQNYIKVGFFDFFDFKEGYEYRFRFAFQEDLPTNVDSKYPACFGQQNFTVKVVPEYVKWNGPVDEDGNPIDLDWNNDDNWSRVTADDILRTPDTNDKHVVGTQNPATMSYAPLDFTKVVIPAGATYPRLHSIDDSKTVTYQLDGSHSLKWAEKPWLDKEGVDNAWGTPTARVQFDMVSLDSENNLLCRPWYANTCDQIHFKPNAEMMGQQHMVYDRAWIDMEMTASAWHTLASPLKATVAGDMYLPTAGARQATELFMPITFDNTLKVNNRFKPAVYQRSWNKATANVYKLDLDQKPVATPDNVAVRTTWSNVFNDVAEAYTPGQGFSIKTDISDLEEAHKPAEEKVLFRLPKDDTSYDYFNADGTASDHHNDFTRQNPGKLLADESGTINVTAAAPSKYFMVGNPYMAHFNVKKFIEANASKINRKYWMLTGDGQAFVEFDADGNATTNLDDMAAPGFVAPMQGFFVEAKSAATSLPLDYNADMTDNISYAASMGSLLRTPILLDAEGGSRAVSAFADNELRITARAENGSVRSQAVVKVDDASSADYDEAEDVALIVDNMLQESTRVYTVAGTMVASLNRLPQLAEVEVGLMAAPDAATRLTFTGELAAAGLTLYDAATGETVDITDGADYVVEGPAAGRLFLAPRAAAEMESSIAARVDGRDIVVTIAGAECDNLTVRVFDTMGNIVAVSEGWDEVRVDVEPGIYIVDAASECSTTLRTKLMVK